jgi:predicted HicB family RNase H-like nuclease
MLYKGYIGWYELNDSLSCFQGKVANTKTLISFQGHSIASTIQAFHEAVDEYLSWCERYFQTPEPPLPDASTLNRHHKDAI